MKSVKTPETMAYLTESLKNTVENTVLSDVIEEIKVARKQCSSKPFSVEKLKVVGRE